MRSFLQNNPEVSQAWNMYTECRLQQLVTYKTSKGKDTILRMTTFPQGYSVLPKKGGMEDQDHRLFEFFGEFMEGERIAFFNPK